jgi:hypothetical protein
MSMGDRKCYTKENISKFHRRMKVNGGDFIVKWISGGIFFQNTILFESKIKKNGFLSPKIYGEKNEENGFPERFALL